MRCDGRKLKKVDPMYRVVPHIMVHRHDAMNMITLNIPLEPIQKYIRAKAADGVTVTHMGVLIAAYLRTIAEFPALNRFIYNRKVYAHKDITVSMVVLKNSSQNDETISKIHLDVQDDIFTVQQKINEYIADNRKATNANNTDHMIDILTRIPGLLRIGVAIIKFADRCGLLPKPIIELSPFHASLLITNLASIRTNHIYHHVYDFGTTSISMAMGTLRDVPKHTIDGELVLERCIPVGMVMDERIATGSYFARAFRVFKRYLKDPSLLEAPPAVINIDE